MPDVDGALDADDLKLTPYWWEAAPLGRAEAADLPAHVDVAIVGAGFAGLAAALTLARGGRSVAVLDAQIPGEGASSRNGGICSGNLKPSLSDLIGKFGLDKAKTLYGEGIAARRHLADLVAAEKIDCRFDLVGRFTGACRPGDYDALGREGDILNKHLGIGAEMVPRAEQHRELGSDFYHGGQVRPDIGGLHPGLFHGGLLARARDAGAIVAGRRRVLSITPEKQGFTVHTEGRVLAARDIIVATNGYTGTATPWLRRRIIPIKSQVIVTVPLGAEVMDRLMPKRRMLGETRNLYNYYRPSPDGRCVVFGGRAGTQAEDPRDSGRHLYRKLIEIFPELEGVGLTHSWSGFTGFTFDLLPHGCVRDGIHYATGFCGSGVVWAPWFGRKAALRILGDAQAASTFDGMPFRTMPFYFGTPWFLPAVVAWYGWRDRAGF